MEGLALESFNVIGRTAMFLGTAIDTALEAGAYTRPPLSST